MYNILNKCVANYYREAGDNVKLSEIVKTYRSEHGLSMERLAANSGLTKGYISMIETGKNPATNKPIMPTIETLSKLANGMNITLDQLISAMDDNTSVIVTDKKKISDEEIELIVAFRQLNIKGRQKLFDYIDDLSENKKYTKDTLFENVEGI